MMDEILQWVSQYGYAGLFVALMFGIAGLPIPDETLLVFYGYLVGAGRLNAAFTFGAAICGSICGISLSYFIGRLAGYAIVIRYGKYVHVTPAAIDRVHRWFARMGRALLTFGYFIVGVRHVTALVAGMSKLEYPIFAVFAYSGAIAWVATFLAIGYYVGEKWRDALRIANRYSWALAVVLAVAVGIWLWCRYAKRRRAGVK